jgi:hypothetical protein
VLTGIAALLTAVATIISTVVDVWPDRNKISDEPMLNSGQSNTAPGQMPTPPEREVSRPPEATASILTEASPPTSTKAPAEGPRKINLVQYEGDGCFYAVDVLQVKGTDLRVRFLPFGYTTLVPASAIRETQSMPDSLQWGATVFVPGAWARPGNSHKEFYTVATINDIKGSQVHVRLERENPCAVSRHAAVLPSTAILVERR